MNSIKNMLNQVGLSDQEQDILLLLSEHLQSGVITPQFPMYNLFSSTGVNPLFEDQKKLAQLFEDNIVVWKTNAGLLDNVECRNPISHRKLSGVLYMSPSYMKKHIDVLFKIANINMKPPYEREEFDSVLANVAGKEYDFSNVLTKKNKVKHGQTNT